MAAEIVNLNKARKARMRVDKDRAAAENRIRYGRTKSERERLDAEEARRRREIEGARRDGEPAEASDPSGSDKAR